MASAGVAHSPAAAADSNLATPAQAPPPNTAVDEAWASLISFVDGFPASLGPLQQQQQQALDGSSRAEIAANMAILRAGGLLEVLHAYVLSVLDRIVRDEVAPRFWALLDNGNGPQAQGSSGEGGEEEEEDEDEEEKEEEAPAAGPAAATRRDSYGRVKSALLYVAGEVHTHLSLVQLLDSAAGGAGGGESNTFSSTHTVQARYRCAFTAQVMAGAHGDFHGTMRAFFDRNLRFWHRSWLDERRRRRRSVGGGEGESGMDVSDDGGDGDGDADGGDGGAGEGDSVLVEEEEQGEPVDHTDMELQEEAST